MCDCTVWLNTMLLVILQPFKEELPEDFKCKDKFLVQTAPIKPALESLDISSMVRLSCLKPTTNFKRVL